MVTSTMKIVRLMDVSHERKKPVERILHQAPLLLPSSGLKVASFLLMKFFQCKLKLVK